MATTWLLGVIWSWLCFCASDLSNRCGRGEGRVASESKIPRGLGDGTPAKCQEGEAKRSARPCFCGFLIGDRVRRRSQRTDGSAEQAPGWTWCLTCVDDNDDMGRGFDSESPQDECYALCDVMSVMLCYHAIPCHYLQPWAMEGETRRHHHETECVQSSTVTKYLSKACRTKKTGRDRGDSPVMDGR
ncbi:hypothetical protein F4680DRAFT_99690 [Xylaria scruposa]|nr:hypothetical protein F4680DRAFT_99690 [Xylaria scruposa]